MRLRKWRLRTRRCRSYHLKPPMLKLGQRQDCWLSCRRGCILLPYQDRGGNMADSQHFHDCSCKCAGVFIAAIAQWPGYGRCSKAFVGGTHATRRILRPGSTGCSQIRVAVAAVKQLKEVPAWILGVGISILGTSVHASGGVDLISRFKNTREQTPAPSRLVLVARGGWRGFLL